MKLIEEEKNAKKKRALEAKSLLKDDRFSALFKDPDFEVDPTAEEYRYVFYLIGEFCDDIYSIFCRADYSIRY